MKNYITYFLIIFLSNDSHQRQIQKTDQLATIDQKYFSSKIQYDDYSQFKALYRRRFWKVAADNHKKLHLKKLQSINFYYEVKYSNLDKMTI